MKAPKVIKISANIDTVRAALRNPREISVVDISFTDQGGRKQYQYFIERSAMKRKWVTLRFERDE